MFFTCQGLGVSGAGCELQEVDFLKTRFLGLLCVQPYPRIWVMDLRSLFHFLRKMQFWYIVQWCSSAMCVLLSAAVCCTSLLRPWAPVEVKSRESSATSSATHPQAKASPCQSHSGPSSSKSVRSMSDQNSGVTIVSRQPH